MDPRTFLAGAAAALAAACTGPAQGSAVVPQIIYPKGMPSPYAREPARQEILAFQQYGRQIADLVSSDPNFGGFMFVSEPEPHAIVMFTGDAETRLRRYTSDPRFKPRRVDFTLAELERMKDRTSEQLIVPGAKCLGFDADEAHNAVTVSGPPHELEMVQKAIAEGRFVPPPKLRLVAGSCVELR